MQSLKDQCVLILGLGNSGLAMAQWCTRLGARVVVADTRAQPPALPALQQQCPQAHFINDTALDAQLLQRSAALTQNVALKAIFKSPGLAPEDAAPLLQAARQCGIYCGGELSLFIAALGELGATQSYHPKILAVTGTNGKTTTVALCTHLLQNMGVQARAAGNIGPSLLAALMQQLDSQNLPDVWILELSSFQLQSLNSSDVFAPDAAVILNISEDHLDWHGDMQHYLAAKAGVFGPQTRHIRNRDDLALSAALDKVFAKSASEAKEQHTNKTKHKTKKKQDTQQPTVRSFGSDVPIQTGDFGLLHEGGMAWLAHAGDAADESTPAPAHALMPVPALRIHGTHNALNALAALALCQCIGHDLGALLHGLRSYRGEAHRTESVAVWQEVEYFDDSKATNVGATLAALHGLGQTRRLIPILGGMGKGQDFTPLAPAIAQYARAVVLIGCDGKAIATALQDTGIPLLWAATMEQAVQQAAMQAQAGDAVLLSPACASFDMFVNYAERAQTFRVAVQALQHELVPTTGEAL